jgi:hypothetical protein
MFYHIRITQKSNRTHDETKVDLSDEQLRQRYLLVLTFSVVTGDNLPSKQRSGDYGASCRDRQTR